MLVCTHATCDDDETLNKLPVLKYEACSADCTAVRIANDILAAVPIVVFVQKISLLP